MENNLLNCSSGRSLGLTDCTHAMDVGVRCPDTDECESSPCDDNANCENLIGSFQCTCKEGFTGNGSNCENINECLTNRGGCDDNCSDTFGSFLCSCINMPGYELGPDMLSCVDVDECKDGSLNNCTASLREECTNIQGSFVCICPAGYDRQNVIDICTDIDECIGNPFSCGNFSTCNNTEGNFTCDCLNGYEQLDRFNCRDVDECINKIHDCDVNAACLNTDGSFGCMCNAGYTGNATVDNCEDVNECLDTSARACDANALCMNSEGSFECQCFLGYVGNGLNCSCTEGDSRLVNSNNNISSIIALSQDQTETCQSIINDSVIVKTICNASWSIVIEGRVEVCRDNVFGTVCDNRWDRFDAQVVCRQLRANSDDVLPVRRSSVAYGEAINSSIILSDLNCNGSERNLLVCSSITRGQRGVCDHSEDAGVKCGALCENFSTRILIEDELTYYSELDLQNPTYYIDDELAVGRIELCWQEIWNPICEDFFTIADASVTCHQLGFSRAGAIRGSQRFQVLSQNIEPVQLNFNCTGAEDNLSKCLFSRPNMTLQECLDPLRNAYIACQAGEVPVEDCNDGDVRLQNGLTVREGRVEVCNNQAWGSICSIQFTEVDAGVVCSQMNFEREEAEVLDKRDDGITVPGSGPIFLSTLDCDANMDNILSCRRSAPIGITNCMHSQDVYVRCQAFCPVETETTSHGSYRWPRIRAELNTTMNCQYGGSIPGLAGQLARRSCDPRGQWVLSNYSECATLTESLLANISVVPIDQANVPKVVNGLFSAITQANDTQDQSVSNLESVSRTLQRLRNDCGVQNPMCSISSVEVEELTNALDSLQQTWNPEVLMVASAEIAELMEGILSDYTEERELGANKLNITETFTSQSGNITYTAFKKRQLEIEQSGVTYSVRLNSGSRVSLRDFEGETGNSTDYPDDYAAIMLPPDVFLNQTMTNVNIVFSSFSSSDFYPLVNKTLESFAVASNTISATVLGNASELNGYVFIVLRLHFELSQVPSCVFWDRIAAGGRGNWSAEGCQIMNRTRSTVLCRCNHLSTFGVLVNTNPVQCDVGFLADSTVTRCIPQKPDVAIYDSTITKAIEETLVVEEGREFQVLCLSNGTYRGNVAWRKINSENEEYVQVPEVDFGITSQVTGERPGQLYAYRVNNSAAYLGTRDNLTFGASIGIKMVANGMYICDAQNDNENAAASLTVNVIPPTGITEEATEHIRFSSASFEVIQDNLNLSKTLILAIFETGLLKMIGTDLEGQQFVECQTVTSRPIDVQSNWSRVACQISNHPVVNVLITRLRNTIGTLQDNLPRSNLFTIYDVTDISRIGFCNYEEFESPDNRGQYNWTETIVSDQVLNLGCFYGAQIEENMDARATRRCTANLQWTDYDGSQCATRDTDRLRMLGRITLTAETVTEVVENIVEVVRSLEEDDEQSTGNLVILTTVYTQIGDLVSSGALNVTDDLTENTAIVLNDISVWPPEVLIERSSSMVGSFETVASSLVSRENFAGFELVQDQITVSAAIVNDTDLDDVTNITFTPVYGNDTRNDSIVESSITLPQSLIERFSVIRYLQTFFATSVLLQLLPPSDANVSDYNFTVDSEVLGFTIPGEEITNTSEPVVIRFQSLRSRSGMTFSRPSCVSWNFNAIIVDNTTRGNWTPDGCELVEENGGVFTCHCNHLTNFAVLVNTNAPVDPIPDRILQFLTIIGSALSMLGLVLTIFTVLFFKKQREKDTSKFHSQLCLALFLMLLTFAAGIDRTENAIVCTIISSLILYFTLVSAFWMGAEAVLMFKKLIIVFGPITKVFIITTSLICWGVPLLFPAIGLTTLATGSNYLILKDGYCFIRDNRIRYGIFLVPLFSIIAFNVVIFVMVARVLIIHSMKKAAKVKDDQGKTANTVKILISIISVMVIFGLSWLFGALSVDKAAIVFQWFFVLFSTSQGFLLFIFFCIISNDARQEWKKLLTCNRGQITKKGKHAISGVSVGNKARGYGTKSTTLTSKSKLSSTLDRSVDRQNLGNLNSSVAPLEMDEFTTNTIVEEDSTNLIISNGYANQDDSDQVNPFDSQLPPQILFRLKRPFEMEKSDSSGTSLSMSPQLNTQATEIDMDGYGEHNIYFDDVYDDEDDDKEYEFNDNEYEYDENEYETDSNSVLGFSDI